ncbi:MAG: GH1 family beta-glucosidase [Bacilli bacterium]
MAVTPDFDSTFYSAFPNRFVWGVASAAYQIEGAAQEDGRGPSIWDTFSHTPGKVLGDATGDIACDHYHRHADDITLMKSLGLEHYRLSFSWTRLFPEGKGRLNQKGADFYERLVEELLDQGIAPFATLYHWDLPSALQQRGGWTNRDTAQRFEEYAATVFDRFKDRIKGYITHNEPWCAAFLGHMSGEHAPGLRDRAAMLTAGHHLLLSHGLAVREYRRQHLSGQIGVTLNLNPIYAATDSDQDRAAAARQDLFNNTWFLDPVLRGAYPDHFADVFGSYPQGMRDGDLAIMGEPTDFLGVNFYSYAVVAHDEGGGMLKLRDVTPHDRVTDMGWPVSAPALTDLLVRLTRDYGPLPLYVTENGAAYPDRLEPDGVHDEDRIRYLRDHFLAMAEALRQGVDLRGYYLWTFMDNFEWAYGYTKRFGIVHVDYETQKRTPKDSALWYANMLKAFQTVVTA